MPPIHTLLLYQPVENTILQQLSNIESWSNSNNLVINKSKTKEIIFYHGKLGKAAASAAAPSPGIEQVSSIKMLGVTITDNFSIAP